MNIKTFEKKDIAVSQLETAIRLYQKEEDFFSALTLAGAAEEILGKLVTKKGIENSLESRKAAAVRIHKHIFGRDISPDATGILANRARNAIKHLNSVEGFNITMDPKEHAVDMINRAIENYWLLEHCLTPVMEKLWD